MCRALPVLKQLVKTVADHSPEWTDTVSKEEEASKWLPKLESNFLMNRLASTDVHATGREDHEQQWHKWVAQFSII
jgi:hypothetical protein